LLKVDYKTWGVQRFDPTTGKYEEDDTPGNSAIEFSCPNCSIKLDPEPFLAWG
jgi:hypothetical protein